MMRMSVATAFLAGFGAACVGVANADTVSLAAAADNTMYEYDFSPDSDPLSNGMGQYIFAGKNGGGFARRALIRFDLAGAVPEGATITGVSLTLHLSQTIAGPVQVSMHRALASWGEGTSQARGGEGGGTLASAGDATWFHRFFSATTWTVPGGDFAALASSTQTVDGTEFYTFSGSGLVADVSNWIAGTSANNGWCLIGDESLPATAKRFDSRHNVDVDFRPVLVIEFTPAAGCVGDYNQDGGVDGSDIEAFFTDWEAGEGAADVNQDGGVDGGDVEFFFTRWEAGC
ncbi:MAG: DNRLRE domain-containing protein [Planctomycetota bacterium]|nr:DNRLRE domain-containing protein [Planctomycetota bacterium]